MSPASCLADARAFVALADAGELASDPQLLRAWSAGFGAEDDATLAVYAPDVEPAAAEARLRDSLAAVGLQHDGEGALVVLAMPRSDALELDLAHTAHARLSRKADQRALAALPTFDDGAALRECAQRRWSFGGVGRPLRFVIPICAPNWADAENWGDLHFARAIAGELRRRGHEVLIQPRFEWRNAAGRACDVALHLRGLHPYVPRTSQLNLLWCISHPETVRAAECDRYDAAWSASRRHAETLSQATARPVEVLPQATDPAVFFPDPDPAHIHELVFVGNSRLVFRPILRDLLPTDRDLAIWGLDWESFPAANHVVGSYLPNDQVRRAYTSAAIVLNDHWDDMRNWAIISNRVYDVLACGGMLVSDEFPELREEFGDAVCTYRTRDELHSHIARLLADPKERARRGARGRELVLAHHTFSQRVDTLLAAVARHLAAPAPSAAGAVTTRLRGSLQDLRRTFESIRS